MKKRIISAVLACGLALAALAGCGSGSGSGSGASAGAAAPAASEAGAQEETKEIESITMYLPTGASVADMDAVLEKINAITEEKIGVNLSIRTYDFGQWFQQYSLFLSGTEDLDILVNYGGYANAVAQGAALELDDLLAQYGQSIVDLEGEYLKSGQIGGVQYAIPVYSAYANGMGIEYRADVVRELGLEDKVAEVKTLADWGEILAAVKEAKPEMTPFVRNSGGTTPNFQYGTWDSLGDNYGVLMNGGADTTVENLFASDEYKELCSVMHDWYENGYTSKDIQTQTDSYIVLTRNDAAFSTLGNYDFNSSYYNSTQSGKEIGFVGLCEPFAKTYTNVTYTVMSTTKHPEACVKFLNLWFSDPEVASLISYGIEGTHYQLNEEGVAEYLDGQSAENCTYHLGSSLNNTNGVRWITENPDYVELLTKSNAEAPRSKALGFSYDNAAVANYITQLDNVCSKYQIGLETGALDPETALPEFNQALQDAGIDAVIAEKQTQFDAWLAQ